MSQVTLVFGPVLSVPWKVKVLKKLFSFFVRSTSCQSYFRKIIFHPLQGQEREREWNLKVYNL